jgi:hypothetical protein
MEHFVAVWLVRHVAFLKGYSKESQDWDNLKELKDCEKEIFRIPFMEPYKLKYYLLTHFPSLHDNAVKWKKRFGK